MSDKNPTAILLMSYGTPQSLDEIEQYYTHIRGGRAPLPQHLHELKERYRKIGGKTPLLEITLQQAAKLEDLLNFPDIGHTTAESRLFKVFIGMKHWHPFIEEAVGKISDSGIKNAICLVMAPHYSTMSIGRYIKAVESAQTKLGTNINFIHIKSWWSEPLFLQSVSEKLTHGFQKFRQELRSHVHVIFTAHSLPSKILSENDPYKNELIATCNKLAELNKLARWSFSFQSAGKTGDEWLGPDLLSAISDISRSSSAPILVCPVGFVSDHLEILYDIDIEAKQVAKTLGVQLERTESLNTSDLFIKALENIILSAKSYLTAA